ARPRPHPVRGHADLRDAREARPPARRGGGQSRIVPPARLPRGDPAAEPSRRRRRRSPHLHPRFRLLYHAGAARLRADADDRQSHPGAVHGGVRLAVRRSALDGAPRLGAAAPRRLQSADRARASVGRGAVRRGAVRRPPGAGGRAALRLVVAAVYVFLFLPIVAVVLLSFSENISVIDFGHFTLRWYEHLMGNAP